MDNTQIKALYSTAENWLNTHSHRDRVYILIAGFIIIYLLWYLLLEKPMLEKGAQLNQAFIAQKQELLVFQNEIQQINTKGKSLTLQKRNAEQLLKNNVEARMPLASQKDNDVIIQTILTPQENVHFLSLDNTPGQETSKLPSKNNVQVSFKSDYFATIHYLSQLEKLPWCLSWDSLEYKVANYPDALVVINLHIVNG